MNIDCITCGSLIEPEQRRTISSLCMPCGEEAATRTRHTIVPMAKSNYIVVTDLSILKELNKYASTQ